MNFKYSWNVMKVLMESIENIVVSLMHKTIDALAQWDPDWIMKIEAKKFYR